MRTWVFLVLMLSLNAVLGISTDKNVYSKGDVLSVNSNGLTPGSSYVITAFIEDNVIFTHDFIASSDYYAYDYNINFLEPSGDWSLIIAGEGVNDSKSVIVEPTRDSSSYLVSFISPISRTYERTNSFDIEVELSMADEVISGALVQSFNNNGERVILNETEAGVYVIPYSLSVNSMLGIKSIIVTAIKDGLGGQGVVNITVNPARINLELVQPELNNYDIGSVINLKISAKYPNGSVINSGVNAFYGSKPVSLVLSNDYYTGSYSLTPSDDGLVTLIVNASDVYGNSGFISKKITGSGIVQYYLLENIYYIIAAVVLVSVLFYFSRKKFVKVSSVKSLKENEENLIERKKKLQEDYFVKGSISKASYDKDLGKIDDELNIIKGRLKD